MASPAPENVPNGISTPPATNNAPTLSPPTQPQPTSQQPSQQSNGSSGGSNAPANPTTITTATSMNPAFPATSLQDPGTSKRPRDARLIHLILANMGVHAYTERVPLQLLDFAYRYTSSMLSDALSYEPPLPTTSSSKKRGGGGGGGGGANAEAADDAISLNALRTAVGARAASTFQSSLGKEFMSEVALERNRIALPRVEREFGIRLPPERYCFTGVGWGVKGAWEEDEDADEDVDVDMEDEVAGSGGAASGAGLGGPVGDVNGSADARATTAPVEGGDTAMGGMGEGQDDDDDDDEFEEAMGLNQENNG